MVYLFEIENVVEQIDYVRECEVVAVTIDGEKKAIVHVILKKEYSEDIRKSIIQYINEYIKNQLPKEYIPFAYKIRQKFDTSPISGKRESESLKYETEGYYIIVDNLIYPTKIESEESKHPNEFVQDVKKLQLKI